MCDHEEERKGDSNRPLSTSTHKGTTLGKIPHISAHIPPLLLSETWMIWLFDDSLFLKSVSAPYVSNMRLARHMNALPWGLRGAIAVFKPGGRIGLWTQTGKHAEQSSSDWIQVHVQGNIFLLLCMPCSLSLSPSFFYYELIMLLKAISAVFEYLGLGEPNKSSRIKLWKASLSLFPLPSWGSILVIIIGSPVFCLAGVLNNHNASRFKL